MAKVDRLEECHMELKRIQEAFQRETQFYIWALEEHIRDSKGIPLTSGFATDTRLVLKLSPQPAMAVDRVAETAERFERAVWETISMIER